MVRAAGRGGTDSQRRLDACSALDYFKEVHDLWHIHQRGTGREGVRKSVSP